MGGALELSAGWVDDLTAALIAGGIRSATVDAADLNLPGVLIKPTGFESLSLASTLASADLYVAVPDMAHDRALAALVELGNKVLAVIDPAGPARLVTLQLPDASRVPALLIPYDTPTDTESE